MHSLSLINSLQFEIMYMRFFERTDSIANIVLPNCFKIVVVVNKSNYFTYHPYKMTDLSFLLTNNILKSHGWLCLTHTPLFKALALPRLILRILKHRGNTCVIILSIILYDLIYYVIVQHKRNCLSMT